MAGRIVFHYAAFNEFRSQAAIAAELHARGEAIAAAAGEGDFKVIDSPNRTRARVIVITATEEGKQLEATDRALSKALDAGRS